MAVPSLAVIPAKAGIQFLNFPFKRRLTAWIPAFAGMTILISGAILYASEDVTITTKDGRALAATWSAPAAGQPTVVMLHGLASWKGEWDKLAAELQKQGFGTLAYDARGHGQSSKSKGADGGPDEYRYFGEPHPGSQWERMIDDVGAVLQWLDTNHKVKRETVVLAGASLGANVALNYAALSRPVRGVMLLSPGLSYAGIETQGQVKKVKVPLLIVAHPADTYAFQSSRILKDNAPKATFWTSTQPGHGVQMIEPGLSAKIVAWIKSLK